MPTQKKLAQTRARRGFRVRNRIRKFAAGRPRLTVFRSNKHTYAQVIDDAAGRTLAAASTTEEASGGKAAGDAEAAAAVGRKVAERAKEAGVTDVVFDRGRYAFHGRVAAVAQGARDGGLSF